MKKILNSFFVIIAAMIAFAGCVKEEPATSGDVKTVKFFAESIDTKSVFGTPNENGDTYPTLWTENDKEVKILVNLDDELETDIKTAEDFKSMSFNADIKPNDESKYQFSVISPETVYLGKTAERFAVTIPTTQEPLENSVEESAQILYAVSETYDEIPSRVNLTFKHFTAYGLLSFTNLNLGDAVVQSVAITSSVGFANRWNYYPSTGVFEPNSAASTITLSTNNTENLWFACAPVGDMNGKELTFTINTNKGPLSKTVTLSGDKYKFEAGKIAKMTVNMAGIEFAKSKVYELVTSADDVTPESEIIIVATESNQALSTTQNGNNRAQASITKSLDNSTITDPGNDVQVLIVGDGSTDGTISLSTGEKYLYAPGGGNYLRETTTLNENASWTVSVTDSGVATIKANRSDRNWIRYNSTSNPPIFSCYTSGQTDVAIYKLQGTGSAPLPKLAAPTVTATLNDDQTGINVSWEPVANAEEYVIYGVDDEEVTTTGTKYNFEELTPGTYTISVKATADGYKSATGSAEAVNVPYPETGGDVSLGESYSYTFTAKQWTTNGAKTLNGVSWTLAGGGNYWGYDATKGQQFGSSGAPYKSMTLSTTAYSGGVKTIVINTSGASSIKATLTVTVGGVQYGSAVNLTTSATEYTFEAPATGMCAGEIKFSYTQTSSKALYIKSIKIN